MSTIQIRLKKDDTVLAFQKVSTEETISSRHDIAERLAKKQDGYNLYEMYATEMACCVTLNKYYFST